MEEVIHTNGERRLAVGKAEESVGLCVACDGSFISAQTPFLAFETPDSIVRCHLQCVMPMVDAIDELDVSACQKETAVRGYVRFNPRAVPSQPNNCFSCNAETNSSDAILLTDHMSLSTVAIHYDCWPSFKETLQESLWQEAPAAVLGRLL